MTITSNSLRSMGFSAAAIVIAVMLGYTLPGATYYGFFLAGLVIVGVLSPFIIKWHYALLLLSWNATAVVYLIPGRPQLWAALAALGITLAVLRRCIFRDIRSVRAPSVLLPVLATVAVVFVTAYFSGGFGVAALGGQQAGGRHYFLILAATLGFVTMLANPASEDRVPTYVAFFFLGSLTNFVGSLLLYVPGQVGMYVNLVFPVDAMGMSGTSTEDGVLRFFGLAIAAMGAFYFILARYGVKDLLRKERIHVVALLAVTVLITCLSGFRSFFVLLGLTFLAVAYFEGLLKTRYALIGILLTILTFSILSPFANRLPLSIQRTLSVLTYVVPLNIDPVSLQSAENSTEWRWEMWRDLIHEDVPQHLLLGKGLGISAYDLTFMDELARTGRIDSKEFAKMAGNYHNGALTVLIPFGLWGALAWLWFLIASIRALYRNFHFGSDKLKKINTFLLGAFVAKTIYFFAVFGDFRYDFPIFVGLIGLGLSLNQGIRINPAKQSFVAPLTRLRRTPVRRFAGISRGSPRPVRS